MTDHSFPADFGGGIAPSSHGVIANNAIEGANGYGVWVNARGQHSAKFPDGSAGPTVGAVRLRPVSGCEVLWLSGVVRVGCRRWLATACGTTPRRESAATT